MRIDEPLTLVPHASDITVAAILDTIRALRWELSDIMIKDIRGRLVDRAVSCLADHFVGRLGQFSSRIACCPQIDVVFSQERLCLIARGRHAFRDKSASGMYADKQSARPCWP